MTTKEHTLIADYSNVFAGVAWTLLLGGVVVARGQASSFSAAQAEVRRESEAFATQQASIQRSLLDEFGGQRIDARLAERLVDRWTSLDAIRRQLS